MIIMEKSKTRTNHKWFKNESWDDQTHSNESKVTQKSEEKIPVQKNNTRSKKSKAYSSWE